MNEDRVILQKVIDQILPLQSEIATRNDYIQRRDDYIYGDSLMKNATFTTNGDKTLYNWLERVVDIHVSQLMGRGVQIYSTYDKRDLSVAADIQDPKQMDEDKLVNKRLKANADARRQFVQAIIDDNGGEELFQTGAESGAGFGFTVYKSYLGDSDEKPWHIEMLENLQNYWAIWSSDNFREKDGDVYMDQISPSYAYRTYGEYLDSGETFETNPMGTIPLDPNPAATVQAAGNQPMVTRIEFTGYLPEVRGEDGELYKCDPGEETKVNLLLVGGKVCRTETDENKIPRYYVIPNRRAQRRPWGLADVTDTCIEVNRTYIERMSDWITLGNKLLFTKFKAIGFEATTVPAWKPRTTEAIPMDQDQDIRPIDKGGDTTYQFETVNDRLMSEFIRSARISRVLFDDPQASASNSNQALMTSMKGTIDAVEKKQQIWQHVLTDMFEDALRTVVTKYDQLKEFIEGDENWSLYVKWPSILRKEDPTYQQMLLNRFNAGTISVDSFLEEQGTDDPGEEMDRIRDNMADTVPAAILGRQLPALAQSLINPAPDPNAPKPPEIKHTVNWRADMTPQQEANLASTMPGFQDGPFGMSMGPQGNQGLAAQENTDNAGFLDGNPFKGGTAITRGPNGEEIPNPAQKGVDSKDGTAAPAAVATPGENTEGQGVVSQPGSGAPAVSPQGAIDQANQQAGA